MEQLTGKINYGSVIQTEFHESSQRSSVSVGKRHQRPRSSLASLVIGTCDRKSPNFWSHQCKQKIQSLMSRTVLLFFCSVCSTMGASPRGHLCVMKKMCVWVLVASFLLSSVRPYGLQPARLLCPWHSRGTSTGVGFHTPLQVIFPTQGSNLGLLQCKQILSHLSHQGSPYLPSR